MLKAILVLAFALPIPSVALAAQAEWEGQIKSVAGKVQAKSFGALWHDAAPGGNLQAGDRIKTGVDGTAVVALPDGSELKLSSGTLFEFNDSSLAENSGGSVALFLGRVWAKVQKAAGAKAGFEVHTPTAVAGVRGTELDVGVADDGATLLSVAAGTVAISGDGGDTEVKAGEQAECLHGGKPGPAAKGGPEFGAWADARRQALFSDPRGAMKALMAKIKKEEQDLEAALAAFKALDKETSGLIDKARLARSGKQKDAYKEISAEVEKNFSKLKIAAAAMERSRNRLTMGATAMRHAYKAAASNKDLAVEIKTEMKALITELKNERPKLQKLRSEFKAEFRQKMGEAKKAYREFKELRAVKEKVKAKKKGRRERE